MSTPSLHSKKKKQQKIRPSLTKGNKNSCKIKSSGKKYLPMFTTVRKM